MKVNWLAAIGIAAVLVSGHIDEPHVRAAAQQPATPTAQPPAFEAAILKPSVNDDLGVTGGCRGIDSNVGVKDPRMSVPLGRCVITAGALRHLLTIAFGIPLDRISGLPEWDRAHRFDIQAKADDPQTTEPQLRFMLQQFLIEEFTLRLHREVKQDEPGKCPT